MPDARHGVLIRFMGLFAMMYAAFGVASPFLPSYFSSRGLTPPELAVLLSAGTTIRLFAGPLAGRIADKIGSLRRVLMVCLLMAAGFASGLLLVREYWPLMLMSLLHAAALAPTTQLADAMTIATASPQKQTPAFEYGWVRGTGSAAFIVGTLVAGQAIALYSLGVVIWLQAALLIMTLFMTFMLHNPVRHATADTVRSTREEVLQLLRIPTYRWLVVVASLVLGSHAMHDAFAMLRWQAAGINAVTASALWSEAVAGEVLVFYVVGPALLRHISPASAIAVAAVTGLLRWTVMSLTASVPVLMLIQPLHGLTFALLHMACMRLLARTVPPGMEGTAQAIYGTVGIGSVSALLTLASGSLYAALGAHGFLAMAMLCLIALPLSARLRVDA